MHATNPAHKITDYGTKTGTSVLRKHLYDKHIDSWVQACDHLSISITAQAALPAVNKYRRKHGQAEEATTGTQGTPRAFSSAAFLDALVEWIVADDQVCI